MALLSTCPSGDPQVTMVVMRYWNDHLDDDWGPPIVGHPHIFPYFQAFEGFITIDEFHGLWVLWLYIVRWIIDS